jgi:lipoprotein NlpI
VQKRLNGAPGDWPSKVAAFLLDKISPNDFLAAASSPDPKKESQQHCEASFYAGMKCLLAGDKITATADFQKCLATNEKTFTEYQFAQAELKALGPAPQNAGAAAF